MDAPGRIVTPQKIAQCEKLIRPHIRRTPVVEVDASEFGLAANPLTLKLELLQHSGSFKARGAFTNLLTRTVPETGVVAASGGNHGAAVAYAAMKLGKPAKIFVPSVSSPAKVARIRDYGADLAIEGDRYADALAASRTWAEGTGAPQRVGECVFPIVRRYAPQTVLVCDEAIANAQAMLWRALRIVAEPGGAAAFSALLSGAYAPQPGERVAVVISGGNTAAVNFDI